jgi:hypothetical protein
MVDARKPSDISNVFAMNEPQHVWLKLAWELQHLTNSMSVWEENSPYPEPIFRAFNTAVTAWHVSDWLWQSNTETRSVLKKKFKFSKKETSSGVKKGLKRFQDAVAADCRALYICRELANGSKHMRTSEPDPAIKVLVKWDAVVEGVGLAKPGDLQMSLIVSDGAKEQDAILWFIDAFGYWERLFTSEKLFGSEGKLPSKLISGAQGLPQT